MTPVLLTRRALLDIADIRSYSLSRWGTEITERYMDDLDGALERLSSFPDLLHEKQEQALRLRFYPVGKHVLICDVIQDRIYVLALRHVSMDLPGRLSELEPQLIHEANLLHDRIQARND